MIFLEVMSGPMDGHRWDIDADALHIGSGGSVDVAVPHDPAIPSQGVVLRKTETAFELVDGSSVQQFAAGDLFQVGHTWLRATLG